MIRRAVAGVEAAVAEARARRPGAAATEAAARLHACCRRASTNSGLVATPRRGLKARARRAVKSDVQQLLLILVAAVGVHLYWGGRAIDPGPGQVAPREPIQRELHVERRFDFKGYQMTALAEFDVEARVLSARRYRHDASAELSPIDLALGWGPMSDGEVLDEIDISQHGRFYHWSTRNPPIPITEIGLHSANMHLIPADASVEAALEDVRRGHVVRFRGELVKVNHPDGFRWKSSLTRRDAGGGACEVVFVRELEVVDRKPRS